MVVKMGGCMFLKKGGISRRRDEKRKGDWYTSPHYVLPCAVIKALPQDRYDKKSQFCLTYQRKKTELDISDPKSKDLLFMVNSKIF